MAVGHGTQSPFHIFRQGTCRPSQVVHSVHVVGNTQSPRYFGLTATFPLHLQLPAASGSPAEAVEHWLLGKCPAMFSPKGALTFQGQTWCTPEVTRSKDVRCLVIASTLTTVEGFEWHFAREPCSQDVAAVDAPLAGCRR